MSENIETLLSTYAKCYKAYFEEGYRDDVYDALGEAGKAIVDAYKELKRELGEALGHSNCYCPRCKAAYRDLDPDLIFAEGGAGKESPNEL